MKRIRNILGRNIQTTIQVEDVIVTANGQRLRFLDPDDTITVEPAEAFTSPQVPDDPPKDD